MNSKMIANQDKEIKAIIAHVVRFFKWIEQSKVTVVLYNLGCV